MDGHERRAPIVARHEVEADPRSLRRVLNQVERSMDGIDGRTRRRALLLVGALADHRLRLTPDKRALMHLTIARAPDRLHIEASADEHPLPPGFWEEVGQAAAVGLVDSWGIDRRRHAAAWFEILTAE